MSCLWHSCRGPALASAPQPVTAPAPLFPFPRALSPPAIAALRHRPAPPPRSSPGELAAHQPKVFRLDEHAGIALSGLTSDGRSLLRYMRGECLNHRFVFGTPLQAERLVADVADKHQRATWSYVRRPYGVGLLVAAYDVSAAARRGSFEERCGADGRGWWPLRTGGAAAAASRSPAAAERARMPLILLQLSARDCR